MHTLLKLADKMSGIAEGLDKSLADNPGANDLRKWAAELRSTVTGAAAYSLAWPINISQGGVNTRTTFATREEAQQYADASMKADACNPDPEPVAVVPLFTAVAVPGDCVVVPFKLLLKLKSYVSAFDDPSAREAWAQCKAILTAAGSDP